MKIVMINTFYWPIKVGGAEVSVQLLAESMVKAGHDVSVLTLTENKHILEDVRNGVRIYRMPLRNIYWPSSNKSRGILQKFIWHLVDNYNFFSKKEIGAVLRKISPDIVHTNNLAGFSVSVWDVAASLDIPIIHTSRDYYLLHPNTKLYTRKGEQSTSSFTSRLWSYYKKIISQKVNYFVPISSHVMAVHVGAGFFRTTPKNVIYNSVTRPASTAKLIVDSGRDTVYGFLGRLDASKGVEIIIDAFSKITGGAKLLIAGDGADEYEEALKKRANHESIKFIGHTDPRVFFDKIDCLIVPSVWAEPLGRVLLEAYSYGIPVIAASSGGIPEIVKSGITGFLYEKNNTAKLLDIIISMNASFYLAMREDCLNYSKEFDEREICKSYESAMLRAISGEEPA